MGLRYVTGFRSELDWLKRWNQYSPAKIAIKDGDTGRQYSYRDFYFSSLRGAAFLRDRFNVQAGDRVAVLSLNELEYLFLFFSCARLGATLVPISFRLTQREVRHIVNDCSPKLLIHQEEYTELVSEFSLNKCLISEFGEASLNYSKSFESFDSVASSTAMIIYTSGTTGAPKGAMLSHEMIFWNSINTSLRLNISQTDSAVIFLPFFHTGGWNVLTTPFLHRGAKLVFLKKFDADQILQLSESEKCSLLFGVPTTMDMMARSSKFSVVNLSSIRYAIVGGEPMPIELIRSWHSKGIAVRQGYGLTEFGPNVFSLNEEDALRKIGSIGFPNFYIDTRVVTAEGKDCADNEVGELLLRGPMCMTGYWNNQDATAKTIVEGWLFTGDLVRRDEEGYFYVVGRKKEMYKSGGENVYPAEVDKVLRSFPGVREVAVIGVPDEKWGEAGKAFYSLEAGTVPDVQALESHCLKNLAKFKVPKYFHLMTDLPKGDSGKILKKNLSVELPNAFSSNQSQSETAK
jgi:fatty-acyl-CoA synthase